MNSKWMYSIILLLGIITLTDHNEWVCLGVGYVTLSLFLGTAHLVEPVMASLVVSITNIGRATSRHTIQTGNLLRRDLSAVLS